MYNNGKTEASVIRLAALLKEGWTTELVGSRKLLGSNTKWWESRHTEQNGIRATSPDGKVFLFVCIDKARAADILKRAKRTSGALG